MSVKGLKGRHWERITDEGARDVYRRLIEACEQRGPVDDCCLMLIGDYAYNEQLKLMLQESIAKDGLSREVSNYKQHFFKDNPAVGQLRQVMEQQRRILNELKLTPASRKEQTVALDDGFNDF